MMPLSLWPGYYYRDDGLINEFYSSDADVRDDSELQNCAGDLVSRVMDFQRRLTAGQTL